MEGIYFFGEHVRWNLGWNNPNQAGAFVAMWIPWLWGLGRLAAARCGGGSWPAWPVLLAELALWFLLCKTYSRGALLAAAVAGMVFFAWERLSGGGKADWKLAAARLLGICGMLVATGFFSRIDPRFVAHDASAGNRLTLWKGGLQMIAASPWRGWGAGNSGSGFMHWFQPLDATEQYAGMVNSYLHVGVEYGLPVLAFAVALATGLAALGFAIRMAARRGPAVDFTASLAGLAAAASLVVFLVANGFSTLWIFPNLWWLPTFSALVTVATCFVVAGMRGWRVIGRTSLAAGALSMAGAAALWGWGKAMPSEVLVVRNRGGGVTVQDRTAPLAGRIWVFPDASVLGEPWGKELRRLAMAEGVRGWEISVGSASCEDRRPEVIVAGGGKIGEGFEALRRFPSARLVLLHPLGKPEIPTLEGSRVSVIVPMLDTSGGGRRWRAACGKWKWKCRTSQGVGQDVRLVWPGVLVGWLTEIPASRVLVMEQSRTTGRTGQLGSEMTIPENTEHMEND
jgi:hypothetical protein